jgi:hypothetical protein
MVEQATFACKPRQERQECEVETVEQMSRLHVRYAISLHIK